MSRWHRRSVLATGIALATGTVFTAAGASTEKRPALEESDDTGNETREGDGDIELSVSAPESVKYQEIAEPTEDAAEFSITVTNHGDEPTSVEATFEIGPINEPFFLELDGDDCETAQFGVMSRDLGVGEYDWTVTANGETETGTLTVTDDEC